MHTDVGVGTILGTNLRSIPHHQEDADVLSRQPELDGQSAKALVEGMKPLLSSGFGEQPQRDSNPCRHLERVVSLASRRWGPVSCATGGHDAHPRPDGSAAPRLLLDVISEASNFVAAGG